MSKRKRSSKLSSSGKVTLSALSLLGVVAGWNIVANQERTAAAGESALSEAPTAAPTSVRPTSTPWPAIPPLNQKPRLAIEPLPTLAVTLMEQELPMLAGQTDSETTMSGGLAAMPSVAALPTLAPLPTLPEYVPPPPPPPPPAQVASNSGGGGGGGNKSKGS
ncbi:MAG: hypothetical protein ACK2UK_11850 [Candidatus Promineifilaceae bacterium]